MIISVVVVAAIISVVVVKTALSTLTELSIADVSLRGLAAQNFIESCAQEALIHLNRDNTYAGETLNISGGACDISVSGLDNERVLTVSGSLAGYFYNLAIRASMSPFSILAWDNF